MKNIKLLEPVLDLKVSFSSSSLLSNKPRDVTLLWGVLFEMTLADLLDFVETIGEALSKVSEMNQFLETKTLYLFNLSYF